MWFVCPNFTYETNAARSLCVLPLPLGEMLHMYVYFGPNHGGIVEPNQIKLPYEHKN